MLVWIVLLAWGASSRRARNLLESPLAAVVSVVRDTRILRISGRWRSPPDSGPPVSVTWMGAGRGVRGKLPRQFIAASSVDS